MPIPYSIIRTQMASALDAENSDRYTDTEDYIPAVNYAIQMATLAFNELFAQKKFGESILKELTYVKIFQASLHSRVAFDSTLIGMDIWDVFALWIDPTVKQAVVAALPAATDESVYLPDESFLDSDHPAKRITLEEWSEGNHNVFAAGSSHVTCPELIQYAWMNFANYVGGYTLVNDEFEIGVKPLVSGSRVAIAFLKRPDTIISTADDIEFPQNILTWIVDMGLRWISFKQAGKVPLYSLATADLAMITKQLS